MACSDGGLSKSDSSLSLPLATETSLLSTCSHKFRYCSCMQTRISNSKLLRPSSDGMFPNVNTLRSHVVLPRRQVEKNMVSFWMSWLVYQQTKEAGTSHDVGMYLGKKKNNWNLRSSVQQRRLIAAAFRFLKWLKRSKCRYLTKFGLTPVKAAHHSAFLVCRAGYQHLLTWLLSMSQLSSLIILLSSTLCPFLTSVQLQTPTPTSPTLC